MVCGFEYGVFDSLGDYCMLVYLVCDVVVFLGDGEYVWVGVVDDLVNGLFLMCYFM